ncbi:MAG: RNA polymerase sigma factor [Deltaproteobacteria bacterium]|nr:RNA polymerase sigma factor [Deltaproteobacteria bacterium]
MIDDDAKAMLDFSNGDAKAFEGLMKKYYKRILNFIYRFTFNRELSEDLTQEVFLKLYNAKDGYTASGKFSTFLYRIAANHCLNELRKGEYGARTVSIHKDDRDDGRRVPELRDENVRNPQEIVETMRSSEFISSALSSLPERQKTAFILCEFEGFSYSEIAGIMRTSESSVKSLLNRCRTSLVEKLGPLVNGGAL